MAAAVVAMLMLVVAICWRSSGHPSSDVDAESMLLRASGACLARIDRLEELNEIPSDGDHWVKAWLDVSISSGTVPEFLYLVIQYGGHMPPEAANPLRTGPSVLRHDSLRVGDRHWFVFSEDFDSAKFPPKVAGWWPYRDGTVPQQVITAIDKDRYAGHPRWDETLNVIYEARHDPRSNEIDVRVRDADSLEVDAILFKKTVPGKLESLRLHHWNWSYEMQWPKDRESHVVAVATVGKLLAGNPFNLPAATYRISYAFDLATGRQLAVWIARNQEIWLMHVFQQYSATGETIIDMKFDLQATGGIESGGDSENWYRRVVREYDAGRLKSEQVYRHQYIKTGKEPVYSGSGWILVDGPTSSVSSE